MTSINLETTWAMPHHSPSYPRGPYQFEGREYLSLTYESDAEAIRRITPEPLEPQGALVNFDFLTVWSSTGFGTYHGAAQRIPVRFNGELGFYTRLMFLDAHAPIAGGREIWGFPQKLAAPRLRVERDTLVGDLRIGPVLVATGSMGYKHRSLDTSTVLDVLHQPGFLLKIIPHVDGRPRICELVRFTHANASVRAAWEGPAALDLHPHALAPVCDLPVHRIVGARHYITDYELAYGEVVHDYLAETA